MFFVLKLIDEFQGREILGLFYDLLFSQIKSRTTFDLHNHNVNNKITHNYFILEECQTDGSN